MSDIIDVDIYHEMLVRTQPEQVYDAIATADGIGCMV